MFIKAIFFISVTLVFYIYSGYPLLVWLIGVIRRKKVSKGDFTPKVTILIAAYNEETHIGKTIQNKLDLDYPLGKIQIIVVSDGSNDRTDEIVYSFAEEYVNLIRQEPRAGKTSALNLAVPMAQGDILVFSDANSLWDKTALRKIVNNFNDDKVGYVTGKMVYTNPDGSLEGDGCSLYMKYENYLRRLETDAGSVVGVDGGIDAVRKTLYEPMKPDQLPDFVLPLMVVKKGYRVVYEPDAVLQEASLKKAQDEYKMRVRVTLRALWALWDMRQLLTFQYDALFAWQLWSHKVLRYLCFFPLLLAYCANLLLWPQGGIYQAFFLIQTGAYLVAMMAHFVEKNGRNSGIFYILSYFTLLNLASAHAFLKFLLGQKQVLWTPRKG